VVQTWLRGPSLEIRDEFWGVPKFRRKDPCGLFVGAFVPGPTDQVQKFALMMTIIHLGVQHLSDLKLRLIVHIDRRQGRLDPVGDRIRGRGFQHGYMEYRVDCPKAVREPKGDRVGARLRKDLVRPEELVSKLLRWSGSAEERCLDIGSAPDREGQGSGTAGIGRALVLELCRSHVFPEVVVELV